VPWNITQVNRGWLEEWVTLQEMGKPDSWMTLQVRTEGFKAGQVDLPGKPPMSHMKGRVSEAQVETRGQAKHWGWQMGP
jgi:hypothetical protein